MPGVTISSRSPSVSRSGLRLEAGGDHAVAAELEGPAGAGEHQVGDVDLEAEVVEVAAVEAGERR